MAFLTDFLSDPWILWKAHLRICVQCYAKWQPPGVQTTSACYRASVCRAFPVGHLCSSVILPPSKLWISCWWHTSPPGPQPAPSQCTHYPVSTKTASGLVHVSVLVSKPSISHSSVHIYKELIACPVLNWDTILSQRHIVLTLYVSHCSREDM